MSLREFTVQGDGEASALVTTAVEMRGGAHQTRIRARPAYDTARAVGTRLMLYLVVCAWRTRSAPELGPAHSAHIGLAAHAFGRAVSIPLTHPLAFSLSPFLNARLPRPRRCGLWLCCGCLQSMPQAPPRAILYSQGLYSTLKGYSLSRATQSQGLLNLKGYSLSRGLLTLKGATHSQGDHWLRHCRSVRCRSVYSLSRYRRSHYCRSLYFLPLYCRLLYCQSLYRQSLYRRSLSRRSLFTQSTVARSLHFRSSFRSRARPPLLKGCDHSQGLPSQSSPLLRGAVGPSSMTHRLHVYM